MTQYHTKGHENSGNCACFPPLLGERAGVRASVSPTHFRSRRLITQNPKSEIRNPKSIRASSPRLLRSEEHTSELQSRGHLVCRLLLEKKNNDTQMHLIIQMSTSE